MERVKIKAIKNCCSSLVLVAKLQELSYMWIADIPQVVIRSLDIAVTGSATFLLRQALCLVAECTA
jgi:hypothetical protein